MSITVSLSRPNHLFPGLRRWVHMPAFAGWLALSAGIVIGRPLSLPADTQLYTSLAVIAIPFMLCGGLLLPGILPRAVLFLAAGIVLSMRASCDEHTIFSRLGTARRSNRPLECVGTVTSYPRKTFGGHSFVVSVEHIPSCDHAATLRGKDILCRSSEAPRQGTRVRCRGLFRTPRLPANPGAFDERLYRIANHLWGTLYADSVTVLEHSPGPVVSMSLGFRRAVHATANHLSDVHYRGVLLAAFLGEKEMLASTTRELYRNAGIYHLLAISGLHVGILVAAVILILTPLPLPRPAKMAATLLIVWAYLLFIGPIPSLVRAVIMTTVVLTATIFQRRSHPLNALGLAGIVWLLFSPVSLFTPGYQLSFAATFGILTLYPPLNSAVLVLIPEGFSRVVLRPFLGLAVVSLTGFLATAPVLLHHFGTLSPAGLAANLVAVTCMGLAMNAFFFAILTNPLAPVLAAVAMKGAALALAAIQLIASLASRPDFATISLPRPPAILTLSYVTALISMATAARKHLPRVTILAFALFTLVVLPAVLIVRGVMSTPCIAFLSTRAGALTAMRFPNGKVWVVGNAPEDGPGRPWRTALGPWLRSQVAARFDALLLPRRVPNAVHDLTPVANGHPPASLIVCGTLDDDQASEDFRGFLDEHGITLIEAQGGTRFMPSPRCTVTVCAPRASRGWWDEAPGATVLVSIEGYRIALIPEDDDSNPAQRTAARLYRYDGHIRLTKGRITAREIEGRPDVSLEEGAIVLRLRTGAGEEGVALSPLERDQGWRTGELSIRDGKGTL